MMRSAVRSVFGRVPVAMLMVIKVSFTAAIRVCCVSLIASGLLGVGFARERGPRVEVTCPSLPIPVNIEKRKVLVYELDITNFDVVPLTLKRFEAFGNDEGTAALITLEDEKLSAAMIRVGAASSAGEAKDTRVIEPGVRNVVFVWIELPSNRPMPARLKHQMVFSAAAADGSSTDAALQNFQVPVSQDLVPTLSPPFHGGIWLAGNGPANDSGHRRTIMAIDGQTYSPERSAIDWVKIGPNGDTHHDEIKKNENWWGWGEPVLAVADGEITEVVDGIADNTPRVLPPVTLDNIAGNHIILRIAANRFVTFAHLQNGTIKVRLHDHVHRGDVLALLGNSGNATGAHLHLQVTDRNSVLQSQGVPYVFSSFTYLGPGSDYPEKQVSVPWVNSIPSGDTVVEFNPVKD
jgi:hypothetical protein